MPVSHRTGGCMAEVILTKETFDEVVLKSDIPVLVDFWAPWCGPCKMLGPVIESIAKEHSDIVVGKVNVDDEEEIAARYGIMSIPTLILFKGGEIAKKTLGYHSREDLEAWLK